MVTGDQGVRDEDGYFSFFGRDDDVITSSGYRIGPGEIENCLTGHPAVALAAAVGKPDPVRTEIVKAYVVVVPGTQIDEALSVSIRDWVKTRLSAHEYPREIEFVDDLPLTTTGKVVRRLLRDKAIEEAGLDADWPQSAEREISGVPCRGFSRAATGPRCGCCGRHAAGWRPGGHRGLGWDEGR
jgi:acyl-coenzyme A synthetase/AMP-(fatty) acid ligase